MRMRLRRQNPSSGIDSLPPFGILDQKEEGMWGDGDIEVGSGIGVDGRWRWWFESRSEGHANVERGRGAGNKARGI